MSKNYTHSTPLDALQSRVALRITSRLTQGAALVPHDIGERLRVARQLAVERAALARRAVSAGTLATQYGGTAALGGPPSLWLRLASMVPLVVLVGGLVLIQQIHDREQIFAAAEVDMALLADDLPPAAYQDPGFAEFLQAPMPH